MTKRSLVCVVDDDESVRESLPDLLQHIGFAVHAFSSAEAFLASEAMSETDCLLLDVGLPGMSGPDLQAGTDPSRPGTSRLCSSPRKATNRSVRAWSPAGRRRVCSNHSATPRCSTRSTPRLGEVNGPCTETHRAVEERGRHHADVTSIVFVVDDDVSVRESLELLIRTAGWQPETFASAQEFPVPPSRRPFRAAWCST